MLGCVEESAHTFCTEDLIAISRGGSVEDPLLNEPIAETRAFALWRTDR